MVSVIVFEAWYFLTGQNGELSGADWEVAPNDLEKFAKTSPEYSKHTAERKQRYMNKDGVIAVFESAHYRYLEGARPSVLNETGR